MLSKVETLENHIRLHDEEKKSLKTRFILVRHGETSWNLEGRYQGQTDTPLSPLGIKQGHLVAEALKNVPFDAVNKAVLCDILEMEQTHFWQMKQDNTCINVFEYDSGKWRLVLMNSTAHLGFLFSGVEQKGL